MSFVITLYVREGIVMASDSRLTLNTSRTEDDRTIVQVAVGQSESNYKTFLAYEHIGISTYGAADIEGVPIAGYIQSFITEELKSEADVDDVPDQLLSYFRALAGPPAVQFHVAGYKWEESKAEQHVWHVDIADRKTNRLNPPGQQGASWGGEADILARLIQRVGALDANGNLESELSYFPIPWQFFTLQDAIDYARYAVQATIDSIRFQPRPKTVGGPVDILVIRPEGAAWVQHKELHA